MNNQDILFQITARASDETLALLYRTPIYSTISKLSQSQEWWYERTQWLVGKSLTRRTGNWAKSYAALKISQCHYSSHTSSTLSVSILLECGKTLPNLLVQLSIYKNAEVTKMILNLPTLDQYIRNNEALGEIIETEDVELLKLFLEKVTVADAYVHDFIGAAVTTGDVNIVSLLTTGRAKLDDLRLGHCLMRCVQLGHYEIFKLLFPHDGNVTRLSHLFRTIVELDRVAMLQLLLTESHALVSVFHEDINRALCHSCKFCSVEMVKLVLSVHPDPSLHNNMALRLVRKCGRGDVEALLLADARVRDY
ncbi:Hypothetical protein POVR2_LOCUS35 [uncultured virus]|nr:Hypothetical protein POVR2_LOCUS35 [uncultured virus]